MNRSRVMLLALSISCLSGTAGLAQTNALVTGSYNQFNAYAVYQGGGSQLSSWRNDGIAVAVVRPGEFRTPSRVIDIATGATIRPTLGQVNGSNNLAFGATADSAFDGRNLYLSNNRSLLHFDEEFQHLRTVPIQPLSMSWAPSATRVGGATFYGEEIFGITFDSRRNRLLANVYGFFGAENYYGGYSGVVAELDPTTGVLTPITDVNYTDGRLASWVQGNPMFENLIDGFRYKAEASLAYDWERDELWVAGRRIWNDATIPDFTGFEPVAMGQAASIAPESFTFGASMFGTSGSMTWSMEFANVPSPGSVIALVLGAGLAVRRRR